ncbi:hypothetical protein [Mycobacterium kyogaense]|uniref:hypothetical protein n=1 Tax=Mycobacterium kyogaense TaxID=2212479 RepID=UPI0013C4AE64|nr:hypothetical protein [Mycobacterium kyogaense]
MTEPTPEAELAEVTRQASEPDALIGAVQEMSDQMNDPDRDGPVAPPRTWPVSEDAQLIDGDGTATATQWER